LFFVLIKSLYDDTCRNVRGLGKLDVTPGLRGLIASVHPPETNRPYVHPRTIRDLPQPYNHAVHFRHSGWARIRNLIYRSLQRTRTNASTLSEFSLCGSHAYVLRSREDPNTMRLAGSSCHNRFCTPCANERARTVALNVADYLANGGCRFLTLTLQSTTEPLVDLLAKLTKSFAALRRTLLWKQRVTGGVGFIEVKWNADKSRWHPHLHCLLQGRYLPQKEVSASWQAITNGSFIVDIQAVKSNRHAIRYVTKYVSKPLNASFLDDDDRLDEAVVALKGKRLCLTFGDWRGLLLVAHPSEDSWESLGSLDVLVSAAAAGDDEAIRIVGVVCRDAAAGLIASAAAARPPPQTERPTLSQLTFWSTFNESK